MPDIVHETPAPGGRGDARWGSDLLAETLRALGIRYVANVPGSSYRGLHDSIVNHLGNEAPQLILAIHEETAVAIAHGYAKVTERPMAAALHANVGLLRAPMAIYNAWCDRVPMLLLGSTGPWDATRRGPTDWIHTSADQGGLVRDFTKWDDQPGSVGAAVEALVRGVQIASTSPRGPVYVNLDADVQEVPVDGPSVVPDVARYAAPPAVHPAPEALDAAAALLSGARKPLILLGRCSRDEDDWAARVELAERLGAPVLTHSRLAAAFPTDHPLHAAPPLLHRLTPEVRALVDGADVVLALDWPDLAGVLGPVSGAGPVDARVIRVSCDAHSHRGGSADHRGLPVGDLYLLCETDAAVQALLEVTGPRADPPPSSSVPQSASTLPDHLTLAHIADALARATADVDVCFTRLPLAWKGADAHFDHPLDHLGGDGGGGIGSGPGITVGAALALVGTGRLPVGVIGDGDFLMGCTAIWTAAHYGIGCLLVVENNRSFHTDEVHQRAIAVERERPRGNRWIGTRLDDPPVDLAGMARAQGALGLGPVRERAELDRAIEEGVAAARAGQVCVVDVWVPRGGDGPPDDGRVKRVARGVKRRLS